MDPENKKSATEAAAIIDLDPDFEPQSRPRSCTWPLPRPELATEPPEPSEVEPGLGQKVHSEGHSEPILLPSRLPEPAGGPQPGILGAVTGPRKGGSRRNAWGNQSYAELISQAIESAPEKRLTLAQIYEWMVRTVPYFKDKGDSNSSAGWKVSMTLTFTSTTLGPLWVLSLRSPGYRLSTPLGSAKIHLQSSVRQTFT